MSSTYPNVTFDATANVYFEGKCMSHTFHLADGARKTAGVILPASLTFSTAAPEVMDVLSGTCDVTINGVTNSYGPGQSFAVPADSSFDITVHDTLSYVCHYG